MVLTAAFTVGSLGACVAGEPMDGTRLVAVHVEQLGKVPESRTPTDKLLIANEPDGGRAGFAVEFDLAIVAAGSTPLASLHLPAVVKVPVSRPGAQAGVARGCLHVLTRDDRDRPPELVGAVVVKPTGMPIDYTIDVTDAVNTALAQATHRRVLRFEVWMVGKPAYFEVYGLPLDTGEMPSLQVAWAKGWLQDWDQRLAPIVAGDLVYREACLPLATNRDAPLELTLLYPAKKIVEVIHNGTGETLREGRDWTLQDGSLVLPPGSHAPIQLETEFFARKSADSAKKLPPISVRLEEGTWYHERQIEVTYEPANREDWSLPPTNASLDDLPRLKRLLNEKAPLKIVLFGDSIAAGGNASRFQGCWPYQPAFGELIAWKLAREYGNKIVFTNHSRGGATSAYAVGQAASQVGWFQPDLAIIAFGMNDRGANRREGHRQNLETIIDTIRNVSPETEFIVITSMLNNPRQPMGLGPVKFLRDEALKITRPGLAIVDMTTTHEKLLERKKYLDTSGNGANHPNDFLHRLYAHRILEVLLSNRSSRPLSTSRMFSSPR